MAKRKLLVKFLIGIVLWYCNVKHLSICQIYVPNRKLSSGARTKSEHLWPDSTWIRLREPCARWRQTDGRVSFHLPAVQFGIWESHSDSPLVIWIIWLYFVIMYCSWILLWFWVTFICITHLRVNCSFTVGFCFNIINKPNQPFLNKYIIWHIWTLLAWVLELTEYKIKRHLLIWRNYLKLYSNFLMPNGAPP